MRREAPVSARDPNRERAGRLAAIAEECDELKRRLFLLHEEQRTLEMAHAVERYCCNCVNLNSKMNIFDMGEQERRGRVGLQSGLVSQSLSARRACPDCGGSGIPRARAEARK